jgi:uncharacterized coiled-coil protein SlyX
MDLEQRLAVQEALVSALIVHAANRGMIADMIHEAKARLTPRLSAAEQDVRAGVVAQLESILRQLDSRPIAARRR